MNHINEHFIKYWKTSKHNFAMNPILHTYILLKHRIEFETYLEVVKYGPYKHTFIKSLTSSHTSEI